MARMLRIHESLATGRKPNCRTLAQEMEVSAKTVQRDIEFMRDQLLLPIEYDPVCHGYFYTKPVKHFPLVSVSQGELVALLVAERAIEQFRGTAFERPLRSAFEKLAASLNKDVDVSLHELADAVSFRPLGVAREEMTTYDKAAEAIFKKRVISFDYRGLKDELAKRRRIKPLHLSYIDSQWYLIGFDMDREAMRTFALTRISRLRVLAEAFQTEGYFSAHEILRGSFSVYEAKKIEEVVLRFTGESARLVQEKTWHSQQKLKVLKDGKVLLTMKLGIAPDLVKWILGWGSCVEVVRPESLRERMAREAEGMLGIYSADKTRSCVNSRGNQLRTA